MENAKTSFRSFFLKAGMIFKAAAVKLWHGLKRIFENKKAAVGFCILMLFFLMALFGPLIFPYDPQTDWQNRYADPSWQHLLGTDELGRDVFRQLIHGSRDVLIIAFMTGLITVGIGTVLGMISGFVGGITDKIIQMITNLFLTVPSFPIMLLFAQLFTIEDPFTFALVLSAWSWAGLCRAVRAQILSLKERDFIQICKVMKMSKFHIIMKELMPNIASYIFINFIATMKSAITGSMGIMMLGLAAFEPSNWGAMLHRARMQGLMNPKVIRFMMTPLCAIVLFQAGAMLFANGMDETLNPRLRVR